MSFFERYKPFRNYMRRFGIENGLIDVWAYSRHVTEKAPLPPGYAVRPNTALSTPVPIFPWDLDILVRELVLNAGCTGDYRLKVWNDMAKAVNFLRDLENEAYKNSLPSTDIMFELHRMMHRQFPWQISAGMGPMIRALKVFGAPSVEKLVEREFGMTTGQFVRLGAAVSGHFINYDGMSSAQDYREPLGISLEASTEFFRRITCDLDSLRAETKQLQSMDCDWIYRWNPLEATPLIRFDKNHSERVRCPIPRWLQRRTSGGLFFDLVRSPGFDNPFGTSFQAYIGDVLSATCVSPRFTVTPETPYFVGKDLRHGPDWIVTDATGHLFIEAKTKRLTLSARTASDQVALSKDLAVMAEAIVQNYANVLDAVEGRSLMEVGHLPIYPVILTLEDWFVVSPRIHKILRSHVDQLLVKKGINSCVLDQMPYTIAAAHEFEVAIQVAGQLGISNLMKRKTSADHRGSALLPFITMEYREEYRCVNRRLFEDEFSAAMFAGGPNEPI